MLVFVCCMGFIRGKKTGMYLGFLSGLLFDIFYGYSGVIGLTALSYMYLGYVNGLFYEVFYTDDICIPVILSILSDLAYNFLYYCVTFLLRGQLNIVLYFENIMFPEMIYTGCIAVFLFRFLKVINTKLEKFEKRGEENLVKGDLGDYN
jgi:rod shape-determining protein MreD